MPWTSSGRVVNPAVDAVIVDSGQLSAGTRRPLFVLSSSVTATFELQQRDAANATTLKSQIVFLANGGTFSFELPSGIDVAANERLRIITVAAVTGTVSCSVFT